MILRVEQLNKELFSAQFHILRNGMEVGQMRVEGKLPSMEAKIWVSIFEKSYRLTYSGGLMKSAPLPNKEGKSFRPYQIDSDVQGAVGNVYQIEKKEGWFTIIDFFEMIYFGMKCKLYPIGLGKEGGKHPVYCGETQIAQVEKAGEIYNDLHHFDIYAVDQQAAEIAVLFAAYMYINANFKPGEKATKSYVKYTSITTNKTLKSKYNPDFVKRIQP